MIGAGKRMKFNVLVGGTILTRRCTVFMFPTRARIISLLFFFFMIAWRPATSARPAGKSVSSRPAHSKSTTTTMTSTSNIPVTVTPSVDGVNEMLQNTTVSSLSSSLVTVERRKNETDDPVLSHESLLIKHLMSRYQRASTSSRPVLNSSHAITVEFSIALIQILNLEETNQILSTNVWKRYRWKDELLVWRPEDYGGIKDIRLPSNSLWTPDIVLYNNSDSHLFRFTFESAAEQEKSHHELISVYSNGVVQWIPPTLYKSSCQIDMENFPFDIQVCHLKFGSWTHDGFKLNLSFYDGLEDMDRTEYVDSSEWDIVNTTAKHNTRYYQCCGDEPFPDLTFNVTLRRKTGFYMFVLVLPSLMLSFLTLVIFWIPPHRPDRTTLGIYYCINMVIIAMSTMLSAIVINIVDRKHNRPVPCFIRLVFIEMLGRILCVNTTPSATTKSLVSASSSTATTVLFDHQRATGTSSGECYGDGNSAQHKESASFNSASASTGTVYTCGSGAAAAGDGGPSDKWKDGSGAMMNVEERQMWKKNRCAKISTTKGAAASVGVHDGGMSVAPDIGSGFRCGGHNRCRTDDEEWKLLAIITDRFFFAIFLVGICAALAFVFPRSSN